MSYKHYNEMVDAALPFDTGIQRYIFLESCFRADNRGVIRMPQSHLASCLLISRQTISREFAQLEEKGLLEKRNYGQYQIVIPRPDEITGDNKPATPLRAKFIRWLRQEWGKQPEEGDIITITPDADIPVFFDNIITEGYLELNQKGTIKGEPATNYKVHLNP